ncbi:MAG: ATP-dependent Clp protease adaptor ClpS, partial [Aquihabitans sp.]
KEKAEKLMLDVHNLGRAVVSSGAREKAEIDVFRLHEHGLWATMQHDE